MSKRLTYTYSLGAFLVKKSLDEHQDGTSLLMYVFANIVERRLLWV